MKIQHIAVALDLSSTDDIVLQYINMLLSIYPEAKVECTHVMPEFDLATALYENDKEMLGAVSERRSVIESSIREKIDHHINKELHDQIIVHVQDGKVMDKLVYFAGEGEHDLLVLGRKKNREYYGRLTHELIRRGKSNVLLVPEHPPKLPKKIMVPTDFSDNALRAYESAIHFANAIPQLPEIHCVNLYQVPETEALYMGFSSHSERFKQEIKKAANKGYQNFIKKSKAVLRNEKSATFTTLNIPQTRYAEGILHHANSSGADLVVMGAKGQSSIERYFLGSVVEKMSIINDRHPLLVVK